VLRLLKKELPPSGLRDGGKGRGRNSNSTAHRTLALSDWALMRYISKTFASFKVLNSIN